MGRLTPRKERARLPGFPRTGQLGGSGAGIEGGRWSPAVQPCPPQPLSQGQATVRPLTLFSLGVTPVKA